MQFDCLAGPCRGDFCNGVNSVDCWRPYFLIRAIVSPDPDAGFNMTLADVRRYLRDQSNTRCRASPTKNPVFSMRNGTARMVYE